MRSTLQQAHIECPLSSPGNDFQDEQCYRRTKKNKNRV